MNRSTGLNYSPLILRGQRKKMDQKGTARSMGGKPEEDNILGAE